MDIFVVVQDREFTCNKSIAKDFILWYSMNIQGRNSIDGIPSFFVFADVERETEDPMENTPLMSMQPYFVLDSDDFCQHVLFENGISHFFSFSNKNREDKILPLMADGCSNIIFEYRGGGVRTHFVGSLAARRSFSVKKDAEYFGIRLAPGSHFSIPEIASKDTVGKILILDELDFARNLCGLMEREKTFDSRVNVFLDEYSLLCGKNEKSEKQAHLFRQIVDIIVSRKGLVKVSELERLSGYTSRYINKIFENELGFSAKQMCGIVKFQFLLGDISMGKAESLTRISSEYNFYDQSHFIHEFKGLAGMTPSQYAKTVEQRKYSENVRNV